MTSSVALAAAHETTLPPYVPPWVPGFQAFISSARARIPESGRPGRDALGHDKDVGLDAPVLDREQLAGPAEPGLHLVGDEQDPVLRG